MSVRGKLAGLLAALGILAGCASSGEPVDAKDPTVSLVYGYFDMEDAPTSVDWVSVKKYGGEASFYNMGAKDGLFWHVGVAPGSYQVETFGGGGGFFSSPHRYNFGTRGRNDTAIRIKTPGAYFMGSYKFVLHKTGVFEAGRFEMKPVKTPSEKEILQRLVKALESDDELKVYARQINWAKQRIAQLSR
jgi:hypothetical protein